MPSLSFSQNLAITVSTMKLAAEAGTAKLSGATCTSAMKAKNDIASETMESSSQRRATIRCSSRSHAPRAHRLRPHLLHFVALQQVARGRGGDQHAHQKPGLHLDTSSCFAGAGAVVLCGVRLTSIAPAKIRPTASHRCRLTDSFRKKCPVTAATT